MQSYSSRALFAFFRLKELRVVSSFRTVNFKQSFIPFCYITQERLLTLNETCELKLEPSKEQLKILNGLFQTYREIVKVCLEVSIKLNITSRKRLHELVYKKLREKYSLYPSHYGAWN